MIQLLQLARATLIVALLVAAGSRCAAETATANDMALFLAGLQPAAASPLSALTHEPTWQRHARYFDKAWKEIDSRQLSNIRKWSSKNLVVSQPTTFYMFGGPDFLYVDAFLSGSTTYVLSGLETVGRLPELEAITPSTLPSVLGGLHAAMRNVLRTSYFLTKQMRYQLDEAQLKGTLPVLYIFLARSGKTITSAELVQIEPDGSVKPWDGEPTKSVPNGVKIAFKSVDGTPKALYYFNTDLSNDGLRNNRFLKFCQGLGTGDAFVKSAMYLMHNESFSVVRDFLLDHSATILQDDSGIPARFFKLEDWQVHPHGRYLGPIPYYGNRYYQRQLSNLFRTQHAEPLAFGVGYRWRLNQSHLLLAKRRAKQLTAPATGIQTK
jgi:hypothetical protein